MTIAERLVEPRFDAQSSPISALGTETEISAEAFELGSNAHAPTIAAAFSNQFESGQWTDDLELALLRFVEGLGQQRSYVALRESADILLDDDALLAVIAAALHDGLFPTADMITESPLLAGLRLDIALEVAVRTSVPPYRLLALLTGPVHSYPEDFDDPMARAIGVAADIWTTPSERERFAATLQALVDRGSEDAAYEAAVGRLRSALARSEKAEVITEVRDAKRRFDGLAARIEGRDDAAAFSQTCAALIAFDEADGPALAEAAQVARDIAQKRSILNFGMHKRNQNVARQAAELAWISLAWQLETAAAELEHDAFLDTWVGVDAIISVFDADRRFTNLQTINALVRPRLVNEIAQRAAMTHQLERAINVDEARPTRELPAEIYELWELVRRAHLGRRESHDSSEESSHEISYLRALLGPSAALLKDLSITDLSSLETAARQTFVGTFAGDRPVNDVIDGIAARLMAGLSENVAFVGVAKSNFALLVLLTVRFLVYVGDTAQPYTARIGTGQDAPLEAALQRHFAEFLSGTELAGRVGMEHSNIAGGRADVIVTFDGARRYVTEVKRELTNSSPAGLEAAYSAQALEYQSTNEPFGQLLVLDLTDHSRGTPHVADSIWVSHRRDANGRITNSMVVAVVRGNRPTPSAMR